MDHGTVEGCMTRSKFKRTSLLGGADLNVRLYRRTKKDRCRVGKPLHKAARVRC